MTTQSTNIFTPPSNLDIQIWRYMDFTKFVSMLQHKGLFFSRSDLLGDPFEGSYPKLNTISALDNLPDGIKGNMMLMESIKRGIMNRGEYLKLIRPWTYVSCWHMSEHESAAMWKLYSQSSEAICIVSSYRVLNELLPENAFLGSVIYRDYEKDTLPIDNFLLPFMSKRKSFEHEQELRAIIWDTNAVLEPIKKPVDSGIWCDVDLARFIDNVYVSPNSPSWYVELVAATIEKFGFKFTVKQFSLDAKPLW